MPVDTAPLPRLAPLTSSGKNLGVPAKVPRLASTTFAVTGCEATLRSAVAVCLFPILTNMSLALRRLTSDWVNMHVCPAPMFDRVKICLQGQCNTQVSDMSLSDPSSLHLLEENSAPEVVGAPGIPEAISRTRSPVWHVVLT